MAFRKLLLCTAALSLLPAYADAQSRDMAADPVPAPSGAAVADADTSGDIIVTAQKREERLQDVPISISTQSAEQLQAAGVVSTKELTKVVPGLVFAQNEAFSQPAIRGVTTSITSAGAESPVAVYVDGVYQPSQAGVLFDLPDVDRIEVLKGPQGTLFGRNATGGAIQIFTKQPTYDTTGKFTISDGVYTGGSARTAHEVNVNGFVSTGLVDGVLAGSVAGYYRYNPGYMTNDRDGSRTGEQRSQGVRGKLLWEPSDSARFELIGYYSKLFDRANYNRAPIDGITQAAAFPDAVIPTEPWHVSQNPERLNYLRVKAHGVSLRGDFDLSFGSISSITGYSNSKNFNFVDSRGAYSSQCQAAFRCLLFNLGVDSEALSQELNFVSEKFGIASVTGGLFYYRNFGATQHVDVFGGADGQTLLTTYDAKTKSTAYAAFAELNLDPTDDIHVILGGRYSHEKQKGDDTLNGNPVVTPSQTSNAFTPRASIRYEFNQDSNIYFTYSKGFKSGVLPPPAQPARIPVKPEKLESFEVGVKTVQGDIRFNAAYFHYNYNNLQLTKFIGTLAFPQNAGSAKMDGFDVDATWTANRDINFGIAFNYTPTAKFKEYLGAPLFSRPANACGCNAPPIANNDGDASGLRMIRIPKFSGNISFNWSHEYEFGKLGLNANVYHSSRLNWDVNGTVQTKPYEDVSGQVFYEKGGMRFAIFGKNLLNKAAITGSQPSDSILPVLYLPPRQIGASVSYSF